MTQKDADRGASRRTGTTDRSAGDEMLYAVRP
jgi:hypothetical protein